MYSLTRFSNELARSSIITLDSAPPDRMVLDGAAKLDAALIAGTGDVVNSKRTPRPPSSTTRAYRRARLLARSISTCCSTRCG